VANFSRVPEHDPTYRSEEYTRNQKWNDDIILQWILKLLKKNLTTLRIWYRSNNNNPVRELSWTNELNYDICKRGLESKLKVFWLHVRTVDDDQKEGKFQ